MTTRGGGVGALVVLAALLLVAAPVAAQTGASREMTLDLRPWSAELALAWGGSDGNLFGFSVGLGANSDLNWTARPDVGDREDLHELEQILMVGPLFRHRAGRGIDLDIGLRFALASVRSGGDLPGLLTGVHAGVFFGGRHVRVGSRVVAGRLWDGAHRDDILHVDLLTGRLRLPF